MRTRPHSSTSMWALLPLLTMCLHVPAAEVAVEAWVKRYSGKQPQFATDAAMDASGNVVVTGSRTLKYAAEGGRLLWEQSSSGSGTAIAVDTDDNVVVTGSSHNGTDWDYYIVKYAAGDGALLWEQGYDGPAHGDDLAAALGLDAQGNVVVTGSSVGIGSDWDFYTAKYAAADGALIWEQRYNGPANREDKASALAIDASGNVIVTGYSFSTNEFWSADYYTAKYAADGTLLWKRHYNGRSNVRDQAQAIAVDSSGDVVVTGQSEYFFTCDDFWGCREVGLGYTAKYSAADGTLLWEQRSDLRQGSYGYETLAVDSFGNVILAGHSSFTFCPGRSPCHVFNDYYVAKLAAQDGAVLWQRQDSNAVQSAVVDADGNVVVTGSSVTTNGSVAGTDFYTAKYAGTNGSRLWESRYNGPSNSDDFAWALVPGSDGSIVVTGTSGGESATVKYVTVSYLTPVVVSLSVTPEGARLRFAGDAGRAYRLQRASNPAGPWTTSAVLTAPPDGAVEHLDPAPLGSPAFYRIAAP